MGKRNNPNIKLAFELDAYTPDQESELLRCASDVVYFVMNYCRIQHPTRGSVPFKLYPYQERMLRLYQTQRQVVVLSARQTGKSQVTAAFLLWFATFHDDQTVLVVSNKNTNAMELIRRITYMYEHVPHWLKAGVADDGLNKHSIGFDNNSRIHSVATSETSGRGLSISLLFCDELAFVRDSVADEFWTSVAPTLATGGACIVASTPNGDRNLFAQLWRGANTPDVEINDGSGIGINGFVPIRIKWDEPPDRDDAFRRREIGRIGALAWTQEYLCEFVSSDPLLIDSLALAQLTRITDARSVIAEADDIKFYKRPTPGSVVLIGVDPATGSGNDQTCFQLIEFPSFEQIGEYASTKTSSGDTYAKLKRLILMLERQRIIVYFSVENNGVGEALITLISEDYDGIGDSTFVSEDDQKRPGMTTTGKSKLRMCLLLKELIERGALKVSSAALVGELKDFVRQRGSYSAKRGATDDRVMALIIALRVAEQVAQYSPDGLRVLRGVSVDSSNPLLYREYESDVLDDDTLASSSMVY